MTLALSFALASLTACAACNQSPPSGSDAAPPPPPTAKGTQDQCAAMCTNLRRLGCPEGSPDGGTCEATCVAVEGTHTASFHPLCVADAGTQADIRACGTVRCAVP
jgi:hypothetical protein